MAKRQALRVALVLDLDEYQAGLTKAKTGATKTGAVLGDVLAKEANKVALKFVSIQAAARLAEKSLKSFVAAAERMEKAGTGNEGTAAVARLSKKVDELWASFVRATASTDAALWTFGKLSDAIDLASMAIENLDVVVDAFIGEAIKASASVVGLIDSAIVKLNELVGTKIDRSGITAEGLLRERGEKIASEAFERRRKRQEADEAEAAKNKRRGFLSDRAGSFNAFVGSAGFARIGAEPETTEAGPDPAKFLDAVRGTVDSFVGSWESGFARLGELFRNFSSEVGATLGGMGEKTAAGIGSIFDSIAFTGPLLQRVFGQSEESAKRFQVAQLALVGAMSVVKGAFEFAEAWKKLGEGDASAAGAHLTSAGLYGVAAGLAGVAAYRAAGAGVGGTAADQGISSADRFDERRKSITVVIQNAIGGEEFVRREIIPAINQAVGEDVVVRSSHATSSDRTDPGRF